MSLGIALDNAAIMSTLLEAILYGTHFARRWQPSSANQACCRIFGAHVHRHHVGVDLPKGTQCIQPDDDLSRRHPPGSQYCRKLI